MRQLIPFEYGILHASEERTRGSETSQYSEEKRTIVIPEVAASERGTAQTCMRRMVPVRSTEIQKFEIRSTKFETSTNR